MFATSCYLAPQAFKHFSFSFCCFFIAWISIYRTAIHAPYFRPTTASLTRAWVTDRGKGELGDKVANCSTNKTKKPMLRLTKPTPAPERCESTVMSPPLTRVICLNATNPSTNVHLDVHIKADHTYATTAF